MSGTPPRRGPRVTTRTGDGGTTGLLGGARVRKDHPAIALLGAVDEAQAFLGLARAECPVDDPVRERLARLETELWVLMAEVATPPESRGGLRPGETAVTAEMVAGLEAATAEAMQGVELSSAFAVPGDNRLSAALDVARTVVRRAERCAAGLDLEGSVVLVYLNRLSDLCWALARRTEKEHRVQRRTRANGGRR